MIPVSCTGVCSSLFVAIGVCSPLKVFPQKTSTYQEEYNNISHEIDLSSSGNGPVQWLGGLYYYKEAYRQPVYTTETQQPQFCNGTTTIVAAVPSISGAALAQPFQCRLFDNRTHFENDSYAAFGQVDWKFTDTLKLTAGLRYNHDHLSGQEDVRYICFATTSCAATPESFGSLAFILDATAVATYTGGLPQGRRPRRVQRQRRDLHTRRLLAPQLRHLLDRHDRHARSAVAARQDTMVYGRYGAATCRAASTPKTSATVNSLHGA